MEEDGTTVNIQDTIVDPESGKLISQLPLRDKVKAIDNIKKQFIDDTRKDYLRRVAQADSSLLKKKTVRELGTDRRSIALSVIEELGV